MTVKTSVAYASSMTLTLCLFLLFLPFKAIMAAHTATISITITTPIIMNKFIAVSDVYDGPSDYIISGSISTSSVSTVITT